MKTSYAILFAGLLLTISSFYGSHADIKTFHDAIQFQNFWGLMGVLAGATIAWVGKSPWPAIAKQITESGRTPTP